ncbi:hypothetical protein Tco_0809343 [Tanacetum coccineum]
MSSLSGSRYKSEANCLPTEGSSLPIEGSRSCCLSSVDARADAQLFTRTGRSDDGMDQSIKVKEFQRSFRHSDTERLSRSDEVLKLKNFKKDATLKLSKSTNQE